MSRYMARLLGVVGVVGSVVLGLVVLGVPTEAAAPKAAATAAPPPGYAGSDVCKGCHEDQVTKFERTTMGRLFLKHPRNAKESLGCESCHGPGKAHADAGGGKNVGGLISFARNDPTPVEKRNEVCTTCHNKGGHLFWKGSTHESRDVACTGCHKVMESVSPRAQLAKETVLDTCGTCHLQKRAQQMRSSHMPLREGKMTCVSCHNPHGTVTPALLKENSANDACFTCHADKRGPFLWEHAPVVESCATCHDPHGSNYENLLKKAKPQLCQQCHVVGTHPTKPYQSRENASLKFALGRSCVDCHVNIHGSNHPSGHVFTR